MLSILVTTILCTLPRRARNDLMSTTNNNENHHSAEQPLLKYDWTAYVVFPLYLTVGLFIFTLSAGLVVKHYLFPDRTQ